MSQKPITVTVWVCVCGWRRGGLATKWRGLLLIITLRSCTKATRAARTIWISMASLLPLSYFQCLSLPLSSHRTTKAGPTKIAHKAIRLIALITRVWGSSLSVLTHFSVSVAKHRLKCLATRRQSILMEWLPHARLPCAWSVWLWTKTTKTTWRRGREKIINWRRSLKGF